MEKIKVKGKLYDIRSIQTIEQHVLQIIFACTPPTKWNGDIVLYTAGDIECAVLTGWNTVYRDEGQTVYLSDDGSGYQTPDPDTGGEILPPEPYVPTLEELQAADPKEVAQLSKFDGRNYGIITPVNINVVAMIEYRTERFVHPISINTPFHLCQPSIIFFNITCIRVTLQIPVKPS